MHFHNQSGAISLNNNSITGSARGVLVNGGSAAWTITGNTVGGGQAGQDDRAAALSLLASRRRAPLAAPTTRSATWAVWR